MRLRSNTNKGHKYYAIVEDYRKNGKRTTRILDKIGNENKVIQLSEKDNLTINEWLSNYFENYKNNHTDNESTELLIKKKY